MARPSADVVLLEDDVARVADALSVAREPMGIMSSSFGLTIGVNTAILFAAALGLLSPFATAVLHNGTTTGVLLNALRRRVTPDSRWVVRGSANLAGTRHADDLRSVQPGTA